MPGIDSWDVEIDAGAVKFDGTLTVPRGRHGVILFADGRGRSRRDRVVAGVFHERGLGTLLLDLRRREENGHDDSITELGFDVEALSVRLIQAIDWIGEHPFTKGMRIGLFGSSSGVAAALIAAAKRPLEVRAVVARGGRPDLASDALPRVLAPTLFVVGALDPWVLELNERAGVKMRAAHELQIVTGASHLFDEPGKLEAVAALGSDWFWTYVRPEQPLEKYVEPHIWT